MSINTESTVFCHQMIELFIEYSAEFHEFFINKYCYFICAKSVGPCSKSVRIFTVWFFVVK